MKNGRFGPYVTDGETNASLRSSDSVETLTFERAVELMAARREARARSTQGPQEAYIGSSPQSSGEASGETAPALTFSVQVPLASFCKIGDTVRGLPVQPLVRYGCKQRARRPLGTEWGRENQRIFRVPWNSEDKCRTVRKRHLR